MKPSIRFCRAQLHAQKIAAAASAAYWLDAFSPDKADYQDRILTSEFKELAAVLGFELKPITQTIEAA